MQEESLTQTPHGKVIKYWGKGRGRDQWKRYPNTILLAGKTATHDQQLQRDKLHEGLCKAESSLAIQLLTEEVRFISSYSQGSRRDFSGVSSGWRRQDPKNVIMFCPYHARNRRKLYETAGTH